MNKLLSKLNKQEYQKKWYLDNKEKINNKHKKAYESKANDRKIKRLQQEINQLDKEGKIINSLIQKKMYERHELCKIECEKGNPEYQKMFSGIRDEIKW